MTRVPPGRQPHLPVQRLEQLLVDPVRAEDILRADVPVQPAGQLGGHVPDVVLQCLPGVVALDHQPGEVLVELVPHDLDQQVRLLVEQHGRLGLVRPGLLGLGLDDVPLHLESAHVALEGVLADPL